MQIERFVEDLAKVRLAAVFNPYADRCALSDRNDAPAIRRANLTAYMHASEGHVSSIWFGRDLGYRGGRRTGLALTDEHHLSAFSARYGGIRVNRATDGPPVGERTATVVWSVINRLPEPPFLWNVFPFHPHEPGDPMSNRCHTTAERRSCERLLGVLLEWLKPRTIVAIGNDAQHALSDLGYDSRCVRHPSYGGQTDFVRGMDEIYGLLPTAPAAGQASLF
jgi:hypothetical protein